MISVCIPTYNGEKYIKEQLESILGQLSVEDEVIISDDCSSDQTLKIIESFHDNRIKVFIHCKERNFYIGTYYRIYNVFLNMKNALSKASGDFIFLSDQDDIWLPNKVKNVMAVFREGYDCVMHDCSVVNEHYEVLLSSIFRYTKPNYSWIGFVLFNFYQGSLMAFTAPMKKMLFPMPQLPIGHEHWIASIIWTHGRNVKYLREPLMLYRRHGNNVSSCAEKSSTSFFFKVSYRFLLLYTIIRAFFRKCK